MSKPNPTNEQYLVKEDAFLVSKTDTKGIITYCNVPFMEAADGSENDVLGKPHNVVRHPDMPRIIFKLLWGKIQSKEEIFAYVKNMRFSGGYYWVYANVTASFDTGGRIIGYYSVRRKVNPKALEIIEPLYAKLLSLESQGGMDASEKYLNQVLQERGESYDEFSNNIQRL